MSAPAKSVGWRIYLVKKMLQLLLLSASERVSASKTALTCDGKLGSHRRSSIYSMQDSGSEKMIVLRPNREGKIRINAPLIIKETPRTVTLALIFSLAFVLKCRLMG